MVARDTTSTGRGRAPALSPGIRAPPHRGATDAALAMIQSEADGCGFNAPERLTGKFAADSSLEQDGFELVVPL